MTELQENNPPTSVDLYNHAVVDYVWVEPELQAPVYDILPSRRRKVPENGARSVGWTHTSTTQTAV